MTPPVRSSRRRRIDWVHLALWLALILIALVLAVLMIAPVWDIRAWVG